MTKAEMDRIWVIDGMHFHVRDQWISDETRRLNDLYLAARKRADRTMTSRYSRQVQQSQSRDIAAALDVIRAEKGTPCA